MVASGGARHLPYFFQARACLRARPSRTHCWNELLGDPSPSDPAAREPMLRRLIGEHIAFVTDARTSRDLVFADRGQLEQVITNLVLNARDAMQRGGRLSVEVGESASGDEVVLRVSDSGTGMSEAVRARAFEPFYTTKPTGEGTGLGLATAFGIVSQSGGSITIESTIDVGTTMTVLLPRAQDILQASPVDASANAATSAHPAKVTERNSQKSPTGVILLTEDEETVRRVTMRILRSAGYLVLEARQGADAILVASHHQGPINLLLTDVVMPEVNGVELAEWYQRVYPDGAVVFMSGYTDDDLFRHGLTGGRFRFVNKPFTAAGLLQTVAEALAEGVPLSA